MRANTRRFDVDTVYPVAKIALVLDALAAEGVPKEDVLKYVGLSEASISSPATRVSLNRLSISIATLQNTRAILISATTSDCAFTSQPTACTASQS
jgi:hypothetical protein